MIRASLLVFLFIGCAFAKNIDNFVWFPTDNGGAVPAFINKSPESIEPAAVNPDNIHFYLYTLNNKNTYDVISNSTSAIANSHWDRNAPVLAFAHGFGSSSDGGSSSEIYETFIQSSYSTNINLVLIHWKAAAAAPWYDVAAGATKVVGEKTAYLINFLVSNGYTTADKVTVSGHSLGAHVAGFAGADYQKLSGQKFARITGLDPALPRFGAVDDSGRIDPSDAAFVDIIHTAAGTLLDGGLAFTEPRGHADFYPNGGEDQPGCIEIAGECSHSRAYKYFGESVHSNQFTACKCNDDAWDTENWSSCDCSKGSAKMGEYVSTSARGVYYLTTNRRSPFAQG
jgi:hypothetical protein